MKDKKILIDKIKDLVDKQGMELVEVNIKNSANPILEVIIYKENGVNLDDCTNISRQIDSSLALDDYFNNSYNIEVASPGLDRNLSNPDDYRRNLNKKVTLSLYSKIDGKKLFTGLLNSYNETHVIIDLEDEIKDFEIKNIASMKQYIDFGR